MISYDLSPAPAKAAARNDLVLHTAGDYFVPRLQYRIAGLQFNHHDTASPSSGSLFDQWNTFSSSDRIPFVCTKLNAEGRTGSWMHLEAGYGQICQFESCIGKSTMELEQPSCAYLKASFSF